MKKINLLLAILFISCSVPAQDVLVDVIDKYYPANPFVDRFSVFLQGLMNNPFIPEKTVIKRTDTTLFYLKGDYILQNPYSFSPSRIEVILAESEINLSGSGGTKDTILIYQLIGYTGKSLQTVKSEFTKFEREFGKRFSNSNFSDIMNDGKPEGSTHNYFLKVSQVSPLSVSWGKMSSNEYAYIVTVRFIARQNEALLPFLADKQQETN